MPQQKLFVRHPILDIGCTVDSFSPVLWWKTFGLHHACFHLLQWSILPLNNTILLWCVRDRMMHLNTFICTILNKLILDILTTIFISEDLEFPPKLVFNQSLKYFEEAKNFRLVFQEVNPHYYILTKNPTTVMSYFRHFPVACTTLWFFLSVSGFASVIWHLSHLSVKQQLSLPSVKYTSSVIRHLIHIKL